MALKLGWLAGIVLFIARSCLDHCLRFRPITQHFVCLKSIRAHKWSFSYSTLIKRQLIYLVSVQKESPFVLQFLFVWSKMDIKSGLQSQASALPMSVFSPVPESPEPVPLVSKGLRLCERWRWSDWGQANCSHLGEHNPMYASIATSLSTMCKDKATHLSFSAPGIFMRNPWVYSMCNGPLQSRNTAAQQQKECFLLIFFLLSLSVKETSFSKIYEEKTQVIKVEDLPTCASACNMLLCGLGFLLLFLSSSPWMKT